MMADSGIVFHHHATQIIAAPQIIQNGIMPITSALFSAKLLAGNFRVTVSFTWGWLPNTRIHNMGSAHLVAVFVTACFSCA
jgi:hypothetical protein